jgi:hypothetical protein
MRIFWNYGSILSLPKIPTWDRSSFFRSRTSRWAASTLPTATRTPTKDYAISNQGYQVFEKADFQGPD